MRMGRQISTALITAVESSSALLVPTPRCQGHRLHLCNIKKSQVQP